MPDSRSSAIAFTDDGSAALVTIDTAERLAARASQALLDGDVTETLRLLEALQGQTSSYYCTHVKDTRVSDALTGRVLPRVRRVIEARPAEPLDAWVAATCAGCGSTIRWTETGWAHEPGDDAPHPAEPRVKQPRQVWRTIELEDGSTTTGFAPVDPT
jgi:hypothetical protein